jgi:hypothetical protein
MDILDAPPLLGAGSISGNTMEHTIQGIPEMNVHISIQAVTAVASTQASAQSTAEPPQLSAPALQVQLPQSPSQGPIQGQASSQQQQTAYQGIPHVVPFSPRLYALVGNTQPWDDKIGSKLGAKYKKHLKVKDTKIDGWTFSKRKLDQLQSIIPSVGVDPAVVQEQQEAALFTPTKRKKGNAAPSTVERGSKVEA